MLKKISFALAVSAVALLSAASASAATSLSGYAWSPNVGWLSFNPADGATVQLSTSTPCSTTAACLSGYAWSSNIGWVSFNAADTTGCPTGSCPATVNMSTGAVSGWARACAGSAAGDCSTSTARTDGWDGWIQLAGTNHLTGDTQGNNGVTFVPSNGQFIGYAWGSTVVGWLQFNTSSSSAVMVGPNPTLGTSTSLTATCLSSVSSSGTNANVNVLLAPNGGTGPYTYSWSNGSTAQSQNFGPYAESASSYQQTISVTGSVTDSATPTHATVSGISCGSVTIPALTPVAPAANAPVLFVHTSSATDANCVSSFNTNGTLGSCTTKTTVHTGGDATVGFSWPSDTTCIGNVV